MQTSKENKKRVIVIGAGPAGLTAAISLQERGYSVELLEASQDVGGMAKSIELWGQRVDLGPHRFFSQDRRVNAFWLRFVGKRYQMIMRKTRIRYRQKFISYPIEAIDLLKSLRFWELVEIFCSYTLEQIRPSYSHTTTFEAWVTRRFGKKLYETFFKSYSEKLWGIPCSRLSSDFAAQRIKNLSIFEAIRSFVSTQRKAKHATLLDCFAYPADGAGQVYEEMAKHFEDIGGALRMNARVMELSLQNDRITGVRLSDGTFVSADTLVSTMPFTALIKALPDIPSEVTQSANQLQFRSTLLVYLQLKPGNYFPDNWVYVHSPELQVGRITNFRNWSEGIHRGREETIICMEYWCTVGDTFWQQTDNALQEIAKIELPKTGLAGAEDILDARVVRIPMCYPVYEIGYESHLRVLIDFVKTYPNLWAIGRYGSFKYNNQDHSILMGLVVSDLISSDSKDAEALWLINTNYDSYYEKGRITEFGLEPLQEC